MFRDEFKERYKTIPFAISETRLGKKRQEIISHQHKEMELIVMEEGRAHFYIDGGLYEAHAGDVLFIPPYEMHRIQMVEGESRHLCICFDLSLLCDAALREGLLSRTVTVTHLFHAEAPDTPSLAFGIRTAFSAFLEEREGWELCAMGALSLAFGRAKEGGAFTPRLFNIKKTDLGKLALDYIGAHYAEKITSRSAACALFLNHSYFCRVFKKAFGCSFSRYLLAYRLEKARIKLKWEAGSVSEIALASGFTDFSYFGKVFKEKYGASPLAYRKG